MKLDSYTTFLKTLSTLPKWIILMVFVCAMSYFFSDTIYYYVKNRKVDPVKVGINQSNLVNSVLREMLTEFNGSRAYVYRFHNGVNYYDGSHKIKSSMDFEVVSNGVSPIGLLMQDVPTSLFSNQMQAIINEEVLGVAVKDIQDRAAASLMSEFGVSHSAVLSYYDNHQKLILMVGVDWMGKDSIEVIEERFRSYVKAVGDILTNQEYKEMFALNGITRSPQNDYTDITYSPSFLTIRKAELYKLVTKANTTTHLTN
jgi:hypothetical protein